MSASSGSLGFLGRAWEMAKHVGGKTLKWGAIGAAIGIPLMLTGGLPIIGGLLGGIGGLFGLGGGLFGGAALGALTPLLIPAGAMAAIGFVTGLFSMSSAADRANAESEDRAAQAEMRNRRQTAMGQSSEPSLLSGILSPNAPHGRGAQQERGA